MPSQHDALLLHSAGLGPEYCSYALRHGVYIKNRIPHTLIQKTPFEALTGKQPDIAILRILRSRLLCQETWKR
jgi:hypothetical protein